VAAVRLNRFLAAAGQGSRRSVEGLVVAGRVTVNGEVERSPARRIAPQDVVAVDGQPAAAEPRVYLLLHKPAGVVTTVRDPQRRPTVVSLLGRSERLFPVGRLDAETTGALVLTNDGAFAHRLMHPRHAVDKVYEATVAGEVGAGALQRLRAGVVLDGRRTAPAAVEVLERGGGTTRLELVLHEGRNRQVRRMCQAAGHPVLALHRRRVGPLSVDDLAPGAWRELRAEEVAELSGELSGERSG
jgi:23S rRNA pseudouridine2605 synthase